MPITATTAAALLATQAFILVIYRLVLHPLSRYPGPRFAALTYYYRAYYDVVRGGGWLDQLKVLHAEYGPVVRVSPNELHFSSPEAYSEIARFPRDGRWYSEVLSPSPDALITVSDPQEASKRRARFGPYFSRKAVLELESTVQSNVNKLVQNLSAYISSTTPADLLLAYRATTTDIINGYLFAQHFNALDYEGFKHPTLVAMNTIASGIWLIKYLPFSSMFPVARFPDWLVKLVNPTAEPTLIQRTFIRMRIKEWEDAARAGKFDQQSEERAIFDSFLDSQWLANKTPGGRQGTPWAISDNELVDECTGTQFAGSETVGNTCVIGTFNLLNDPSVLNKLKRALDEVWSDVDERISLEKLEKIPYLTAVIKESLRLSYGVSTALPRIVDKPGHVIAGHSVPVGTTVSAAAYFPHMDSTIFPDPTKFDPERWMGPDVRELDRYLVAFSKGPRMCLGVNLAWCELYLIFANVFRKLDMEIYGTTEDDLKIRDFFVPIYRGSHLRAMITFLDWLSMLIDTPTVVALLAIQAIFAALYRLLFHPLSKYPGPRLAALTDHYRAYHDVVRHGGWIDELKVLHARYGPVVRVSPNE
ncbi:hypothetical protein V5O48_017520, partial [Marasmius crinis-equi]